LTPWITVLTLPQRCLDKRTTAGPGDGMSIQGTQTTGTIWEGEVGHSRSSRRRPRFGHSSRRDDTIAVLWLLEHDHKHAIDRLARDSYLWSGTVHPMVQQNTTHRLLRSGGGEPAPRRYPVWCRLQSPRADRSPGSTLVAGRCGKASLSVFYVIVSKAATSCKIK
jgi:hypothetical protein